MGTVGKFALAVSVVFVHVVSTISIVRAGHDTVGAVFLAATTGLFVVLILMSCFSENKLRRLPNYAVTIASFAVGVFLLVFLISGTPTPFYLYFVGYLCVSIGVVTSVRLVRGPATATEPTETEPKRK